MKTPYSLDIDAITTLLRNNVSIANPLLDHHACCTTCMLCLLLSTQPVLSGGMRAICSYPACTMMIDESVLHTICLGTRTTTLVAFSTYVDPSWTRLVLHGAYDDNDSKAPLDHRSTAQHAQRCHANKCGNLPRACDVFIPCLHHVTALNKGCEGCTQHFASLWPSCAQIAV